MSQLVSFVHYAGPFGWFILVAGAALAVLTARRASVTTVFAGYVGLVGVAVLGASTIAPRIAHISMELPAAEKAKLLSGLLAEGLALPLLLSSAVLVGALVALVRALRDARGGGFQLLPLVAVLGAALAGLAWLRVDMGTIPLGYYALLVVGVLASLAVSLRPSSADADWDGFAGFAAGAALPAAAGALAAMGMQLTFAGTVEPGVDSRLLIAGAIIDVAHFGAVSGVLVIAGLVPVLAAARALPARGPALAGGYAAGAGIGAAGLILGALAHSGVPQSLLASMPARNPAATQEMELAAAFAQNDPAAARAAIDAAAEGSDPEIRKAAEALQANRPGCTDQTKRYSARVKTCADALLAARPGATGALTAAWKVENGSVTSVEVTNDGVGDASFAACVTTAVKGWTYGMQNCDVSYTWNVVAAAP